MIRIIALLFLANVCFAASPIYIGLDADMSAVAKEGGIAIKRGALIAINEINNAGGVLDRPLELITKDHRGNPARGVANIKSFSKQKDLVAVLGGVHTPVALKELPIIHEHQIIYLDPWAAGTPVVDNGYSPNYVFRISVRDEQAGQVLVGHAKKQGIQKVGLLLENTGWGRSNERSMKAASETQGVTIAGIQWFNWGQKDMKKEISELLDKGAEAIMLVANAPEGVAVANTLLNMNMAAKTPIISHWGIAGGAFVEKLGLDKLTKLNLSVLQTYSFSTPTNPELNGQVLAAYRSQFDKNVTAENMPGAVGTAHAYDLVHLLAKAIKKANTTNRPDIHSALESLPPHQGLVKNYDPVFTPDRHDALWAEDYIISRFNSQGHLIPVKD